MPCRCDTNACTSCACAKSDTLCTSQCHGGQNMDNVPCMNFEAGKKVKTMKVKDVRTALIANGLSIIGDRGELYKRLADQLRKQETSSGSEKNAASGSGATTTSADQKAAKHEVFQAILENEDNHAFILSLSGKPIQATSSKPDMRRAYLLLSAKIHPDKNPGNQEAVKAFQVVLIAYERLSNPEKFEEGDEKPAKRQKTERVSRSNAGCFRTKIKCPQCHGEWGLPVTGVEECAYNFIMIGLKQYICHICSCQFGCMTANHHCPHCRKEFSYDPDDYHRKITCGNIKCNKEFGFWMYKVSERRERDVRKEAKELHEQRMKSAAQKKRRAARAGNRKADDDVMHNEHFQEQLFIMQLRSSCPRCGLELERGEGQDEAQEHLRECNDQEQIKAYKAQVAADDAAEMDKECAKSSEEDIIALKQWEMNGRQVGQLWMLSDNMLKRQCISFDLPSEGKRHEIIQRLAKHVRSQERLMITDGKTKLASTDNGTGFDTCSLKHADEDDLPKNLNSLHKDELQDLCAGYGIEFNAKKDAKKDLIKKFEQARFKGTGQQFMLTCGDEKKSRKAIKEKDAEYVPDE